MQARDDVSWHAARHQDAEDDFRFLIGGACFRERRHAGQRGRTPRAGNGERAHRALLDMPAAVDIDVNRMGVCPPIVAVIAGPPPLKETARRSTPTACLSISPAR